MTGAVVIDGSNLMYWYGQPATLAPVQEAVHLLIAKGCAPHVVFDANAGHVVAGGYKDHRALASLLGVPDERVEVVGKGVQADGHVLQRARDLGGVVVSNDLFRDLAKRFPEVRTRGHLVHGGYHKAKLWLDFDGSRPRASKTR